MIEEIWLIPLGAAAGILGSMIGLGGGIIIVPVLTFLGFPPTLAASNSLFATLSNAAASTISYSKQKRIDYRVGLKLGLISVPGTAVGALVAADVAPDAFKVMFAAVLAASGTYVLVRRRIGHAWSGHAASVLVVAASFFAGIISSFFGVGGGIVFVPVMVAVMGMSMKRAAPTSQFVLLFASFSGMAAHTALGHPDFVQALYLAAGAFVGGLVGARLSLEAEEWYLRIMISVALFATAVSLVLDSH